MKSSLSIWRLLSKWQIDSEDFVIFVDFLENMSFTEFEKNWGKYSMGKTIQGRILSKEIQYLKFKVAA